MRLSLTSVVAILLFAGPALADTPPAASAGGSKMASCAASWRAMTPDQKKATSYKAYSSGCMSGGQPAASVTPPKATEMPPPVSTKPTAKPVKTAKVVTAPGGPAPNGATGVCRNGTYTSSKSHSGACSRAGGVAKWL
jgi:Protein of unknown function (DUF3761)